jgi:hypothetical protein
VQKRPLGRKDNQIHFFNRNSECDTLSNVASGIKCDSKQGNPEEKL